MWTGWKKQIGFQQAPGGKQQDQEEITFLIWLTLPAGKQLLFLLHKCTWGEQFLLIGIVASLALSCLTEKSVLLLA